MSGDLLTRYCPRRGDCNPCVGTSFPHTHCNILSFRYALWFWIAVVSMASPVFLIVFSPFLKTAAHGEAAAAAAVDAEVSCLCFNLYVRSSWVPYCVRA